MDLQPGQIVRVRSRKYLVEGVVPPPAPTDSPLVRLSCVEDDALGEQLEVLWDTEVDARVVEGANWQAIASRGFDEPRLFSAYLNTLRWNCVTSTNARLFQAPYRAGIEVKAFQLEPLRKALLMPRVNLFIADSVGLGKTIEAGLILREMLMRQKVRRTVICCPPSVVRQWKDEMEQRFGLTFMIYDRDYVTATLHRLPGPHPKRDLRWCAARLARGVSGGLPVHPGRGAQCGARQRHEVRHRLEADPGGSRPHPPLRAQAVPVGDPAQRALEQLLGAPGDARPAEVLSRGAGASCLA